MGTLIAKAYPTKLFLKLADHTYVECGNGGKGWSCWGGKTGGRVIRSGTGSTKRADKIAQPDEKANIRCYLINGVCHQAANRILLPAGILVRGARGYAVSHALFGTYGRVGFWPCNSPFKQYPEITGDLPECLPAASAVARSGVDKLDWQFIRRELEIYDRAESLLQSESRPREATDFHLELYRHMVEFNLGPMYDETLGRKLLEVRGGIESEQVDVEQAFANKEMKAAEFMERFNDLTIRFQTNTANATTTDQYETLFDLKPDDQVILADPEIVEREYRE